MSDMWTCRACKRSFGKTNQSHMCSPGLTIDEFFATAHARERPIYELVRGHLTDLGDVHVEAVQVGIFFKNGPTFVQLRPKKKWVAVCFTLPIKLMSSRLSRKVVAAGGSASSGRWYHVVNVAAVSEIDDQLLDWLTEAFFATEDDLGDDLAER